MTRWMCLDVGSKTIGVAVTDPLKITARPLTTFSRQSEQADVAKIRKLIEENQIDRLIVGKPRHLGGQRSTVLNQIEPLVQHLRHLTAVQIEWAEERLSSKEAEKLLARLRVPIKERRTKRDEFSAAVILQWYLEETQ